MNSCVRVFQLETIDTDRDKDNMIYSCVVRLRESLMSAGNACISLRSEISDIDDISSRIESLIDDIDDMRTILEAKYESYSL